MDFGCMSSTLVTSYAASRTRTHTAAIAVHPALPMRRDGSRRLTRAEALLASKSDGHDVRAGRRPRFTDLVAIGASPSPVDVIRVGAVIGGGGQRSAVPSDVDIDGGSGRGPCQVGLLQTIPLVSDHGQADGTP